MCVENRTVLQVRFLRIVQWGGGGGGGAPPERDPHPIRGGGGGGGGGGEQGTYRKGPPYYTECGEVTGGC